MTAAVFSETAIKLINKAKSTILTDALEVGDLYDIASSRSKLDQLHTLYCQIQPATSKVKRNPHWKNVKSAMDECSTDPTLSSKICSLFGNFLVDYGDKHVLVDSILSDEAGRNAELKALTEIKLQELNLEKSVLMNLDSLEGTEGLKVVSCSRGDDGFSLLLSETIATFSYEQLPKSFLTEAANLFADSVFIKKRKIVRGYHRVIFSPDNTMRIYLIDPAVLVRNETAVEKAFAVSKVVYSTLGLDFPESDKRKSVYFFSSIKSLYHDPAEGVVTSGYFSTSAGSNFINYNAGRGIDLRKDPFQKGGEKAEPLSVNFSKLTVAWMDIDGGPTASLNGTSEMFEKIPTSLPDFRTTFSTLQGGSATYLKKVFEYATW